MSAVVLGAALICVVLLVVTSALGVSDGGLLINRAYAQLKQQNPLEKARTAVETLINRLHGQDMPEGIVKSNGRIEATQVDVAAKYPGRLATLTVFLSTHLMNEAERCDRISLMYRGRVLAVAAPNELSESLPGGKFQGWGIPGVKAFKGSANPRAHHGQQLKGLHSKTDR